MEFSIKIRKIGTMIVLVALLGAATVSSDGARAQGGFLDRAKSLMGTGGGAQTGAVQLGTDEIANGLREALKVGTERVVGQIGKPDGFNADPVIHVPLPDNLRQVQTMLSRVGMAGMADDLELKLNRAAEAATGETKQVFWQAIGEMTLEDAKRIYDGPDDAATQYFKGKMSAPLTERMRPIVDRSLFEVGAIQAYDRMIGEYRSMPFVPDVKADLSRHVIDKGLAGMFHYIAKEEAAIRRNPAARTTDILKRVFAKN